MTYSKPYGYHIDVQIGSQKQKSLIDFNAKDYTGLYVSTPCSCDSNPVYDFESSKTAVNVTSGIEFIDPDTRKFYGNMMKDSICLGIYCTDQLEFFAIINPVIQPQDQCES